MKRGRSESGKRPLVFLGVSAVVLLMLIALSFKTWSAGYSFSISEVLVCRELDDSRQPLHEGTSFPYGSRQICLWLKYSSAREDSRIDVSWYYGGSLVLSESVKLVPKDGIKAFYLLKEEGTQLPAGDYRVTVSTPSKVWSDLSFKITKRK